MAILKNIKQSNGKKTVYLSGPEGNALFLLVYAGKLAKQLEWDVHNVQEDMRDGDYEHLIKTFDNFFGDYVDLIRNSEEE
tara:strand:+ start:998 stop:1237 length:240 start_codon:yes stop_codon:yes gene_type:complete